jgi:hypothetical protein
MATPKTLPTPESNLKLKAYVKEVVPPLLDGQQ